MNGELYNQALQAAIDRFHGKPFDTKEPADLIAYALLSQAGKGPWEEQSRKICQISDDRYRELVKVRSALDKVGIGTEHGQLEAQIAELGRQRDAYREEANKLRVWRSSQVESQYDGI